MIATKTFTIDEPFYLESGESLAEVTIGYETLGSLNADRSNAILIGHTLTGNCFPNEWWREVVGPGKVLDTNQFFIVTPNHLGGCYGSTGPDSIDPRTGRSYLHTFPTITIRDIARANLQLLEHLGIEKVYLGIGGSMGGMVLLEMACHQPALFERLAPLAITGAHSAWRLGFSSVIRKTVQAFGQDVESLKKGLELARQIGMLSYRSSDEFNARFGRERISDDPSAYYDIKNTFEVGRYLSHQGQKLVDRFSPHSYLTLGRAMELYDLQRGRSQDPLPYIESEVLCLGITTDILYPETEVRAFCEQFTKGRYASLDAPFGHDAFLVAGEAVADILERWLVAPSVRPRNGAQKEVAA